MWPDRPTVGRLPPVTTQDARDPLTSVGAVYGYTDGWSTLGDRIKQEVTAVMHPVPAAAEEAPH